MASYLLINLNNTRTKLALADATQLLPERANLASHSLCPSQLLEAVADWKFEIVVLCSVVPQAATTIRETFADHPLIEINHLSALGIALDFPDPATIGADRLANAVAVVALRDEFPVVVVDFGTAVTFDIISSTQAYLGGIIAPGLEAMTHYLHERTALLPQIDLEEPNELIGKSTVGAMLSGAVYGYRGLVEGILARLYQELAGGKPVFTVATGGYARLIAADLRSVNEIWNDLTLEGMRVIANNELAALRESREIG